MLNKYCIKRTEPTTFCFKKANLSLCENNLLRSVKITFNILVCLVLNFLLKVNNYQFIFINSSYIKKITYKAIYQNF